MKLCLGLQEILGRLGRVPRGRSPACRASGLRAPGAPRPGCRGLLAGRGLSSDGLFVYRPHFDTHEGDSLENQGASGILYPTVS